MKAFSELIGKSLTIIQPSILKAYYELRLGDEVLGFYRMTGMFFFSAEASGINNEQVEFFKLTKWKSGIDIRWVGKEVPFAAYKTRFNGNKGVVELPRGERLILKFSFVDNTFQICSPRGAVLVSYETHLLAPTRLVIETAPEILDKNSWVILFAACVSAEMKHGRIHPTG